MNFGKNTFPKGEDSARGHCELSRRQAYLGCDIVAEVKRPEDLHPPATCSLPIDTKTGKVADPNWKARIIYVEFADGMRWTPKQ